MSRLALVPVGKRQQRKLLAQLERDLGDGTGRVAQLGRPLTEGERVSLAEERARAVERDVFAAEATLRRLEQGRSPRPASLAQSLGPEARRMLGLADDPVVPATQVPPQGLSLAHDALAGHEQILRLLGRPIRTDDAA